jgi:phosphoribosylanthranilate isomerase
MPGPHRPLVKICGIRTPEAAEAAVRAGADFIGNIFYWKSPRKIDIAQLPEILAAVPGGSRVFVDVETPTDALERFGDQGYDFFQIHFSLDISLATVAAWSGIVGADRLWLAPRIPPGEPFPQNILEFADTIVLDTYAIDKVGGTGEVGSWDQFAEWRTLYHHKRWILAGGLNPENATAAYAATEADVLDFNSGLESAPGVKDPALLKKLFHNLRPGTGIA